jgi:CheY-like chemotaxis protein
LNAVGNTTNPIEALQMVATQKVDLVFLDIHMPELPEVISLRR